MKHKPTGATHLCRRQFPSRRRRQPTANRRGSATSRLILAAVSSVLPFLSASNLFATDVLWNVSGPADFNLGSNWSGGLVPSGVNDATFNNGGTATISATPVVFRDLRTGDGSGGGTVTQTAGTTALTGWLRLGMAGGTNGTFNLNGGTLSAGLFDVGEAGSGTLTIDGGTASTAASNSGGGIGAVFVGGNVGGGAGSGSLTISAGSLTIGGDIPDIYGLILGDNGGSGQVTLGGTGSLTVSAGDVRIGASAGGVNTFLQTGGTANFHPNGNGNWTYVGGTGPGTYTITAGSFTEANRLEIGQAAGAGVFTQDGGTVDVGGTNTSNGIIIGGDFGAKGNGAYNLNGGTLVTSQISTLMPTGESQFHFDGGALTPSVSNTTFLQGLTLADIQNGGAIIDTSGFNITINQALLQAGGTSTGGLTKNGAGTLTLGGANTYKGTTVINAGTLAVASNAALGAGPLTLAGGRLQLQLSLSGAQAQTPVTLTADSTIDVTGAIGSELGNLTIGNQTLFVTGAGSQANFGYGLELGTATLTGNPTFNIANNGTGPNSLSVLTLNGFNENGIARTMTFGGNGEVQVGTSANVAAGTKFNLVSGSVQFDDPQGTMALLNVASGALLNLNTNQTFSAVSGAGVVDVNSDMLTVGSTDNLDSNSFTGNIVGYNINGTLLGMFAKAGTGTMTLTGQNTFGRGSLINNGTLLISGSSSGGAALTGPLGVGPVNLGDSSGSNSARLLFTTAAGFTVANPIVVDDTTSGSLLIGGNNITGVNTYSGTITLGQTANAGKNITLSAAGNGEIDFTGNLLRNGTDLTASVAIPGPGTVRFTGNNTYPGGTIITGGTLAVGPAPNTYAMLGTGPVTLSGATLALRGQQQGTTASGLLGQYYNSTPSITISVDPMSDPDFNLFSTMQQHLNFIGTSLAVTAPTTTGGQTALNWPNNTNGNAFSNQGFNSTSNYEIQYNGTITIKTGGNYTFSTGSDDGSILAVDNNFVVNNNYFQGFENRYGSVTLSAGTHTISIGYFQGGGSAGLVVDYQGPDSGNNLIPIPNSALSYTAYSPSTVQSYANDVSVTANSTIDVSGSLNASMGRLSINGSILSATSSDTTGSPFNLSLGAVALSGNPTFNVPNSAGGGAGSLTLGAISGNGFGIMKTGAGQLNLPSANTYTGTTTVLAGTLDVTGSLTGNNSTKVFVNAGIDFSSASIVRNVAPGGIYAGLGSTAIGSSSGLLGSTADILLGLNETASVSNVAMQWRVRTTNELPSGTTAPMNPLPPAGIHGLVSDVIEITGMSLSAGTHVETSPFVLQMSYDPVALGGPEGELAANGSIYLAWLDSGVNEPAGLWRNATAGDFGVGLSGDVFQNVQSSWDSFATAHGITNSNLSSFLGSYGVDPADHEAWAVVNHNNDFAVVPEPCSLLLLLIGTLSIGIARRRLQSR